MGQQLSSIDCFGRNPENHDVGLAGQASRNDQVQQCHCMCRLPLHVCTCGAFFLSRDQLVRHLHEMEVVWDQIRGGAPIQPFPELPMAQQDRVPRNQGRQQASGRISAELPSANRVEEFDHGNGRRQGLQQAAAAGGNMPQPCNRGEPVAQMENQVRPEPDQVGVANRPVQILQQLPERQRRRFICGFCGVVLQQPAHLRRHILRAHTQN